MRNFDISLLKQYEEDGWVYSQVHLTLPLIIWNYANLCQYDGGHWDDITLSCRGLVTDTEGNIVSKGFSKFFNYSEGKTNIPEKIDYIEVWEKMDGSYIGLFYYGDDWILNSKGSFTSEQVEWAKEILLEGEFDLTTLNRNYTYCFELIYPENRIVCDYGDEKALYFLSAFCNGEEVDDIYLKELQNTIIKFPKLVQLNSFNPERLQGLNRENEEGFVVKFKNGERCKIKFEEYIKLHGLYTRTSSYDIYECLKDGQDLSRVIENAPDEIYDWVDNVAEDIKTEYIKLEAKILARYISVINKLSDCTDKEFAEEVKWNKYKHYLFALRNNKDISEKIWKDIKPEYKLFGR